MFEASKATFESSEKAAEQALTATAAKIANVEAKANLNAATEVFNAANYEKNKIVSPFVSTMDLNRPERE